MSKEKICSLCQFAPDKFQVEITSDGITVYTTQTLDELNSSIQMLATYSGYKSEPVTEEQVKQHVDEHLKVMTAPNGEYVVVPK